MAENAISARKSRRFGLPGGEMTVFEATEAEIAGLPANLRDSGLAAGVLAMARELDVSGNSATSKSMCFRALQDGLRELRELAPPAEETDALNDIEAQRVKRLARLPGAAG